MFKNFFRSSLQVPRLYADFNVKAGRESWDYINFKPKWGDISNYKTVKPLGVGKFSTVTQVMSYVDGKYYTMKQLKPLKASALYKYNREIKVLQNLSGGPNIPVLHDQIYNEEDGSVTLILEYIDSMPLRKVILSMNDFELRYYMFELLKALNYSHSHGIMHRDVKPGNIMIDHSARKVRLIDWGLAEFYKPNYKQHLRVATLHYKAPELFTQYPYYHYSLDSWSLGATLAGIIMRKDPFFNGTELNETFLRVVEFCGTASLFNYLKRYKIELDKEVISLITYEDRKDLRLYISRDSQEFVTPDALDLLGKLLVFDHTDRILAAEALSHPYFESVRAFYDKLARGSWDMPAEWLETAHILAR